jgi:cytoskeletal protein CcmA (bactofilin family)
MFNNQKKQKMAYESHKNQPVINIISEGTVITGKIVTENDFRISGQVNGELEVKGKCIITQSGRVKGDLKANDADISGKADGNVIVSNKLFLRENAHVTGDIKTKTLLIEEGALFDGVCQMSNDSSAGKKDPADSDKAEAVTGNGKSRKEYKPGFQFDQDKS